MFCTPSCRAAAVALVVALQSFLIMPGVRAEDGPSRATIFGTAVVLSGSCGAAPKPGTVCTVPSEAAPDVDFLLEARDGKSGTVPVRTNAVGKFRVELPPGAYDVRLARTPSPWVVEPLPFSVSAGDTLKLVVRLRLLRQ